MASETFKTRFDADRECDRQNRFNRASYTYVVKKKRQSDGTYGYYIDTEFRRMGR